jgi:hypothetical protein
MADRTGNRSYYNLVLFAVGAIGCMLSPSRMSTMLIFHQDILLISVRSYGVSYFAIYLAASGIYPLIANSVVRLTFWELESS